VAREARPCRITALGGRDPSLKLRRMRLVPAQNGPECGAVLRGRQPPTRVKRLSPRIAFWGRSGE
jgi:hypothetical protein